MPGAGAPAPAPRRTTHRGTFAVVAAMFLFLGGAFPACARVAQDTEHAEAIDLEVKAAYLYKFANYVEWPEDAFRDTSQPIVIGVLDADELASELKRMVRGKSVKGRGFSVRRLRAGDDLRDVHILFLGGAGRDPAPFLAAASGRPVLTVSDSKRVFAGGTMVNLVMVDQRLRFEVALPAVQRSRLHLSALMLTAAYRVQKEAP